MEREKVLIPQEEIAKQYNYMEQIRLLNEGKELYAVVKTYGCQQNEADSERLAGMLRQMGYVLSEEEEKADLILVNTCAVREHAELKALSITGQFKHLKEKNRSLLIGICGCMVSQEHRKDDIKMKYPYVDFLFGTSMLYRFPEILYSKMKTGKRQFFLDESEGNIAEGLPVYRSSRFKAWVSIMYGCNNFCTYCIVPYVRGRERSRDPQCVLQEVRELVAAGYKDITLLGQNVNSYGNDLDLDYHFPDLLEDIDKIPGEYLIRFMSSHPKDATNHLFDVMAKCSHVAKQLHLPFQSGNDRVLKEMNRRYTREKYLEEIRYAKSVMPGLVLTSDVIIGFPGETEAEAMDTVSLVEEVGFDALFTFIYSPRPGTKAAAMPDPATRAEKQKWFDKLLEVQNANSAKLHAAYVGKTVRVLVDGESDDENFPLASRTEGNRLVRLKGGKELIGQFIDVKVTDSNTWALYGEPV